MKRAIIIVDAQRDFCEGGALPVNGGNNVCRSINFFHNYNSAEWLIVTTQDWHADPGKHFSDTPDYVDSWPPHCVARSRGAELHPAVSGIASEDATFFKGMAAAAYSGFEAINHNFVPLHHYLEDSDVYSVYVCGLALDYCVKATALDAVDRGYNTFLLKQHTAPVHKENLGIVIDELKKAGVKMIESRP